MAIRRVYREGGWRKKHNRMKEIHGTSVASA
jgi:hypothetical protein